MKIFTVCGAGVGSSMMLKVYAQQILDKEGIEAEVNASDIGSINPSEADIIITTSDFANVLRNSEAKIIRIDNLMDKKYLREQLLETINTL
ncbi:PTS sugar transporter subunit IIB [Clostridium algidicarnis]|uniref:PTS sugar transporter subunit IIB n=1 Tax=Clostridium algidicarnis TaxID=37659 RepID=UPI001C0BA0A9|nr:PTS sugar transporter subunit IIB [Clostridium algidicarnis]MBU3209305.1 PTS sugar transporter subunit IIB [Clostridium algidicarnis]